MPDEMASQPPLKPYHEMILGELHEGLSHFQRPNSGLFVSSISAGIDLSFSVLLIAIAYAHLEGEPDSLRTLAVAAFYPVGFVFVILGRTELFTEQTTLAIVPVLHGQASIRSLARLWAIVYVGNLLGMGVMVALFTVLAPALNIASAEHFVDAAGDATRYPAWVTFFSAVLAGWLMGLLSWLLTATRDTISQIALVWLIAAMIGVGHFQHVIVGAGKVLAGVLSGQNMSLGDVGQFLVWTTLGNVAGGFVFALLLKYSEGIRGARREQLGAELRGERQR